MSDGITEEQGKRIISLLEHISDRMDDIEEYLSKIKLNSDAIRGDVGSIEIKKSQES
jgi:hypothetical protein